MADALNAGQIPMLAQHDPRRRLRTRQLSAAVEVLPDGEQAVRFTCLVHPDDLGLMEGMRGMSFATSELIGSVEGPNPGRGTLELRADAAVFSDEVIARACEQMCTLGRTHGFRLLQFAGPDEARIILDIAYSTVVALGPGLAASAIYDGLRYLFRHRSKSSPEALVQLELATSVRGGDVKAVIQTSDPAVAKAALAAFSDAVQAVASTPPEERPVLDWDATRRTWLPELQRGPEGQEGSDSKDDEGTDAP
ncbi:hypothetical protein H5399_04265 [Tessaracoccus sp. MC1627]|uniref:hypothetical protein n=1 Tax=Tessaracoccus sp. MC1627 TaxID=2760312 RepID=UPI0015FFD7C4|nr:hypothetical protein [Tessaracoccus sp. MC1627]MBB1511818.1 hypothetical protein [Tessaracoccus sp. MC1627]